MDEPSIWKPLETATCVTSLTRLSGLEIPAPESGPLVYVVAVGDYYYLNLTSGDTVDGAVVCSTTLGGATRWIRTFLTSIVTADGQEVTFQPNGTAGQNIYTSYPALVADWGSYVGRLTIVYDGSHASGVCEIDEAATFSASELEHKGILRQNSATAKVTELDFFNGVAITAANHVFTDIWVAPIDPDGSPIIVTGLTKPRIVLQGQTRIESNVNQPAIAYSTLSGTGRLTIIMRDEAILAQNAGDTPQVGSIGITSSGTIEFHLYDHATIETDALAAATSAQFVITSYSHGTSVNQTQSGVINTTTVAVSQVDNDITRVTFAPGSLASPGFYTSWAALYSATSGIKGPLDICIDTRSGVADITTIPAASYSWASNNLTFSSRGYQDGLPTVLELGTNVFFAGSSGGTSQTNFENLWVIASGATSPFTIPAASATVTFNAFSSVFETTGAAPLITQATSSADDALNLNFDGACTVVGAVGAGSSVFRITGGTGAMFVNANGATVVGDKSFGAVTASQISYNVSAETTISPTQPGILDTLRPTVAYYGDDSTKICKFKRGSASLTTGVSGTLSCVLSSTSIIQVTRKAINGSTALGDLTALTADRNIAASTFKVTALKANGTTETGDASTFDWLVIG